MGRTVDELLLTTTASELSEWEAFERATGPIGHQYEQDMLAHIHEQLQLLTYVLGSVNTPKGQECPIPKPQNVVRPHQVFEKKEPGESEDSDTLIVQGAMGLEDAVSFFEARQQQK